MQNGTTVASIHVHVLALTFRWHGRDEAALQFILELHSANIDRGESRPGHQLNDEPAHEPCAAPGTLVRPDV